MGSYRERVMEPHFAQIIHYDPFSLERLAIPESFTRKYGDNFSNHVVLKVPTGDCWSVEVERHSNGVCFGKTWQKFVQYYSLEPGYLVLFRYDRRNIFHVVIIDISATEINYPVQSTTHRMMEHEGENTSTEDSEVSTSQRTDGPMEEARCFTSTHPTFRIRIGESYVNKSLVTLPGKFMVENHLHQAKQVTLRLGGGSWDVKAKFYSEKRGGKLGRGWLKFARENDLWIGDVCVFELVSKKRAIFNIIVFRCRRYDSDEAM